MAPPDTCTSQNIDGMDKYFKIICGASPSITFYTDSGCSAEEMAANTGSMCTTLPGTSSKYYDYTCPSGGGGGSTSCSTDSDCTSQGAGYMCSGSTCMQVTCTDDSSCSPYPGYTCVSGYCASSGSGHTGGSDAQLSVYTVSDCSGTPTGASAGLDPATSGVSRPARACSLCLVSCSPRCR